jgi:hypothetical protein
MNDRQAVDDLVAVGVRRRAGQHCAGLFVGCVCVGGGGLCVADRNTYVSWIVLITYRAMDSGTAR